MTKYTTKPAPSEPVAGPVRRPVSPRIRWKRRPKLAGLRSIGAGPQGSTLHDGVTEYATVYPLGGSWGAPPKGWYWVCRGQDFGGQYMNTCDTPADDEQTAKDQAFAYVRGVLGAQRNSSPASNNGR